MIDPQTTSTIRINALKMKGIKFEITFPKAFNIPGIEKHYDKCAILYYDRDVQDFVVELFSQDGKYTKCRMSTLAAIKEDLRKGVQSEKERSC